MQVIVPRNNSYRDFEKISVTVLPHTDMEEVELPVELDDFKHQGLPLRDRVVVEGHKFRPYRIASSSFYLVHAATVESNW